MKEPEESPVEGESGETSPHEKPVAETRPGDSDSSTTEEDAAPDPDTPADPAAPADDELPEWEPLTPELVEDEAIRGDFMLRWAVILLALLMGWTVIQESDALTHIRSGQWLAENGFLPDGRDPLAATTADTEWVHLSWLFDLVVAGIYGIAGGVGLSVIKALLAATTFWMLSRISMPDVPTWWGSVCAALALVAVFPGLTITPQIVTLFGVSTLLLLLHRAEDPASSRIAWMIPLLVVVWNQLDERAWIGVAILLAYAIGHRIDLSERPGSEADGRSRSLLGVAVVSLLAMVVHPFLWQSWMSPWVQYSIEYPARQVYAIVGETGYFTHFPVWSANFWTLDYFNGAGVLLWIATLTVLILNRSRVRFAHLLTFIVTTLLAAAGGSELLVASLANAVIATLNAQEWYVANFRQTYSVETSELVFSRGGRAVTVIALFGLGFVTVGGHLMGADGRRVGTGFDARLRADIDSYRQVAGDGPAEQAFVFRPSQGDVLNWIGIRPFIDSRLRLFASSTPSIVREHLAARIALRIPPDGSSQNVQVWQESFDRYQIPLVLPRLSGENPDYTTFGDLLSSPDWELTHLGAATAAFYNTQSGSPEITELLASQSDSDQIQRQMRSRAEDVIVAELRTEWPRSPSVYSRYFYRPRPVPAPALQRARHYLKLANSSREVGQIVASTYGTLRNFHRGLAQDPHDPVAYSSAGEAYSMLWGFEQSIMQARGMVYPAALRYVQSTAAFHHALLTRPDNAITHLNLFRIYAEQQRYDLALRHLQEFQKLSGSLTLLPADHPEYTNEQQQMVDYLESLQLQVDEIEAKRDEDLAAGMDPLTLAQTLADTGYPLTALQIIESDLTAVAGDPGATLLYGRLLLETGRTRDGYDQLQGLKGIATQGQLPDWATYAAMGEIVAEDLRAALATLEEEFGRLATSSAALMLHQNPLQSPGPIGLPLEVDPLRPVARGLQVTRVYFEQLLPRMESNMLMRALIHLELGNNQDAANLFSLLLERDPISTLRPVTETYLALLIENPELPAIPDAEELDPTVPDLFADEEAEDEEAEDDPQPAADTPEQPGSDKTEEAEDPEASADSADATPQSPESESTQPADSPASEPQ